MKMGKAIVAVLAAMDGPVRSGIEVILERDSLLRIHCTPLSEPEVLEEVHRRHPDVLITADAESLVSIEIAERIQKRRIPVRVLILTADLSELSLLRAIEAGASGYLLLDEAPQYLIKCLEALMKGQYFITPCLSPCLIHRSINRGEEEKDRRIAELSEQQRKILRLVAQGLNSEQISRELGLSHRTIENHRSRIANKLGLGGSRKLAQFAAENKIGI